MVSFLLAGLGSDFDPFVTSVTTRVEPLSIDVIYSHLLSHEMRLDQHQSSLDLFLPGAHFAARRHSPRGMRRSRGPYLLDVAIPLEHPGRIVTRIVDPPTLWSWLPFQQLSIPPSNMLGLQPYWSYCFGLLQSIQ